MKIAVMMSGQPRNYKQGYEELKKAYLDSYDCDVFIHTWNSKEHKATQFFKDRPQHIYTMTDEWERELEELYQPVSIVYEEPITFDKQNIVDPIWRQSLQNSKSMWYSVKKAFDLTKTGYDAYIRTRFDLKYEPALFDIENLDLSKLHVWDWDTDSRVKHRGLYDVFAIGSYESIGIYSSLITKIDWYLNHDLDYKTFLQGGWPGQDSGLRNEYLLRWHLNQAGVPVEVHTNTIPSADGHIIR